MLNDVAPFQNDSGDEVVWLVDAKNGRGDVRFDVGNDFKSDVTLTINDDNLVTFSTIVIYSCNKISYTGFNKKGKGKQGSLAEGEGSVRLTSLY
jgi:hypothetical protein